MKRVQGRRQEEKNLSLVVCVLPITKKHSWNKLLISWLIKPLEVGPNVQCCRVHAAGASVGQAARGRPGFKPEPGALRGGGSRLVAINAYRAWVRPFTI